MNKVLNRTWLSPLTAVAFVAVAVTGLLMLLHVRAGGIKFLHEWIGVVFALAGLLHLVLNWRALWGHFRSSGAWMSASVAVVLCALLLLTAPSRPERGGGGEGHGARTVERHLEVD